MSESNVQEPGGKAPDGGRVVDDSELVAARRQKLRFLRDELGVEPYGGRVEDLSTLVDARRPSTRRRTTPGRRTRRRRTVGPDGSSRAA